MRDGIIIIYKPKNITSHDVVYKIKKLVKKKVGHTGTLDPIATGVLPICIGQATKISQFIIAQDKKYIAEIKFGVKTNSFDITGEVLDKKNFVFDKQKLLGVLDKFRGEYYQEPPIFSAIKYNGQKLYELAKKNIELNMDLKKRLVNIYDLDFLRFIEPDKILVNIKCSKGTYVRTLGADIAESLGTYGYLTALRRTKCAKFTLSDTILLENLKNIEYVGERQKKILPILTCLCDITVIAVEEEDAAKLKQGQSISPKAYEISKLMSKDAVATLGNQPVAVVRVERTKISPIRVFNLE